MITMTQKELTERLLAANTEGYEDGISEGYDDGAMDMLNEITKLLAQEGITLPAF